MYPLYLGPELHPLVPLVVVTEVQHGGGEAGVHDHEVGEDLRAVLHHAQTRQTSPVLADQGDVLH